MIEAIKILIAKKKTSTGNIQFHVTSHVFQVYTLFCIVEVISMRFCGAIGNRLIANEKSDATESIRKLKIINIVSKHNPKLV